MTYVLYNPHAGCGKHNTYLDQLAFLMDDDITLIDITGISSYEVFFSGLEADDQVVIAGGDGTLNRFINETTGIAIRQELLFFPTGSGNDFAHELGKCAEDKPFPISKYLQNLPTVTVGGKTYRFLNGVGYGIDGYCCQVGDELRKVPGKKINYTAIAIKGLLFHYKPTQAVVKVDGKTNAFRKVWLAPTMNGKFYGGGMMPTPAQQRYGGSLSVMVFHGCGKLRTLMIFPSIFKGKHVKHTKHVQILSGKQISVLFDRPTALQIDGETILGVTSYTAQAADPVRYDDKILQTAESA